MLGSNVDAKKANQGRSVGQLSTHILDISGGIPASGVDIRLYTLSEGRPLVTSAVSNSDGRTDSLLLEGEAMQSGEYELEFDVGPYFKSRGSAVAEPAFLDTVVIRFSISADERYHVPLLVSPWSYSTYRGS